MPEAAVHPAAAMLSEARGLLLRGWCRHAQARDFDGEVVTPWSDEARSWSLLGALLAAWHRHEELSEFADVVAHSLDARTLGDATVALGHVTGSISLEHWNDDEARTLDDVLAAIDRAIEQLER